MSVSVRPRGPTRALITGGAGFLGSHLVDALLARGDRVVVFDHRPHGKCLSEATLRRVEVVQGDVFDAEALRVAARGCATIYHCAAMVGIALYSGQPARTMETEEVGLRNVCAAARAEAGAQVVYASSSAVYGRAGGPVGLDEALVVAPTSNYGTAKLFGENYLAAQYSEHGLKSVALRIFNMFGPRQDERLVIPRFINRALDGAPLEIFGSGGQTRDFVDVADVVAAALGCGESARGYEVVNVCSGVETSVRQLAEKIIRLSNSKSPIAHRAMPEDRGAFEVERCFGGREKFQRLIGPAPATCIEDGLGRTIAWVESSRQVAASGRAGDVR